MFIAYVLVKVLKGVSRSPICSAVVNVDQGSRFKFLDRTAMLTVYVVAHLLKSCRELIL